MSRQFVFLLAVAFVLPGCGQPAAEVAEATPAPAVAAQATRLPVAPMPHLPGERGADDDLIREDPNLGTKIGEVALPEIEVIEKVVVDPPVVAGPPVAVPPDSGPGGSGSGATNPATFPGRTGAPKSRLIREGGGNADSERAVARGLAWLARQQKADGSWEFDQGAKEEKAGATGMALLPFLGAGVTHKGGDNSEGARYRKAVTAGIDYLVKNCPLDGPNAGRMSTDMTAQAIASIALCEAYGMTKDKELKPAAQAAINYLQKAQGANGSWGDTAGVNGDIFTVGWVVQALQSAKLSKDLVVDVEVIKKAIKFLDFASGGSRKSMYGTIDNTDAKAGTTLTAVGLLCRYYIDAWTPSHPGMIDGIAGLTKNPPSATNGDPLYLYYTAQVIHFYEGEDWKNWNEGLKTAEGTRKDGMRDLLVGGQIKKDGPNLGSWDADAGAFGKRYGRLGTTSLSVLTLAVYYRHLPLYKRGADANAVKLLEDK